MGTETDVYRLDAGQAEEMLKRLAEMSRQFEAALQAQKETSAETAKASDELSKSLGDKLQGAVVAANAAFGILKEGARLAFGFIKDGVKSLAAEEESALKLAGAFRGLGYDADKIAPAFDKQAEAIEHTLFVQSESVRQVQALLLQYGVAPNVIGKATDAIVKYAVATGKDAVGSAESLLRAMESGKEGLTRFGVVIKDTGDFTKNLEQASDKLAKQFGGAAQASTTGLSGSMKALSLAEDDLAKNMAKYFTESQVGQAILKGLTEAVQGAAYAFSAEHVEEVKARERTEAHTRAVHDLTYARDFLAKLEAREAEHANYQTEQQIRNTKESIEALKERARVTKKAIDDASDAITKKADLEHKAAEQEATDQSKALNADKNRLANAQEIAKAEEEEKRRLEGLAAAFKKVDDARLESLREEAAAMDKETDAWRALQLRIAAIEDERFRHGVTTAHRTADERKKIAKDYNDFEMFVTRFRIEYVENLEREAADFLKDIETGLVNNVAQALTTLATTNFAFSKAYGEAAAERRQYDLEEQGIHESIADIKKQMAAEEAAAAQQATANVIAAVAQQAAVKAIFAAAEGLAYTAAAIFGAEQGWGAAASSFAAAAAFGTLAGVGYAVSSGLSNSRGFTTAERESLEGQKKPKPNFASNGTKPSPGSDSGIGSATSSAAVATTTAQPVQAGTVINVYNLGVAGSTKDQQAVALKDILKRYDSLKTGSKLR